MSQIIYDSCPLCTGKNITEERKAKDHLQSGESFSLMRCNDCSFLFTQEIPDETSIAQYYSSDDYISHSDTKKGLVNKLYHTVRDIMLRRKWRLISKLTSNKKILDVGCGTGYFPKYMKDQGYDVHGIEVDPGAREYGVSHFQIQIDPPEELFKMGSGKFDVITLWHVLEHIHQLDKYMLTFHSLLSDQGFLIIAVPNHEAFEARHYGDEWAGYDVPRHLWHFTPKTLTSLAHKHNFELIEIHRLPFDPFYNSLLSEGYRNNSLKLLKGPIIGGLSLFRSFLDIKKSSSPVYILKRN